MTHVWFTHVAPSCQLPDESHVCGVWPLQRLVVGLHVPEHDPALHTFWHGVPFCQVPVPSHVCGVSPLQVVVPGVQLPWHTPDTHAWLLQATGALHWPEALQVCTPLFEH